MFNTIFGQLGQGFNQGHMAQQNAAQATQYRLAQQASGAGMSAQQASGAGMSAGSLQGISQPMRWMIDGVLLDFEEFINTLYPDDCAEKTHLILKLKKED